MFFYKPRKGKMQDFATKHGEAFAQRLLQKFISTSCAEEVTNQDYEGELIAVGDTVNISSIDTADWQVFDGSDFSWDSPEEYSCKMVADQAYAVHFKIGSWERLKSWIKNPEGTLLERNAQKLKVKIDKDVFNLYTDVAAGNWIGVDHTAGTVAIATTTGVVTGTGTNFTADMVGKPFKATGHSKWYRIKSYTSATSIVIEDDLDDVASAYTGGAISAGATYTIQAAGALAMTKDNIFSTLIKIKTIFDQNDVPETNRNVVLPPAVGNLLINSTELDKGSIPSDEFTKLKLKGMLGEYADMRIFTSNNLTKNSSGETYALGIQKDWMTFGITLSKSNIVKLEKNSGYVYKGSVIWGRKVADVRRKAGVVLYCKVG